jgi:hypothetical protein
MDAYKEKLDPLRPVAIKANQNDVYAPGHETWETVTCDSCGEFFYIGPRNVLEARTRLEDAAIQVRSLLGEDHRVGRQHQNGYQLDLRAKKRARDRKKAS